MTILRLICKCFHYLKLLQHSKVENQASNLAQSIYLFKGYIPKSSSVCPYHHIHQRHKSFPCKQLQQKHIEEYLVLWWLSIILGKCHKINIQPSLYFFHRNHWLHKLFHSNKHSCAIFLHSSCSFSFIISLDLWD